MIFDIQHYAVHDGPGIRTTIFFKGCPLTCLWCCNPESQALGPELRHAGGRCRACYSCAMACSFGAVQKGPDGPVFWRQKCRECRVWPCVEACPRGALAKIGENVTADDAMARIAADAAFYRNSGGGVTFSGGEPFVQPEFLKELLERCIASEIHTAVETCGLVPVQTLMALEPLVGLFLYDLKIVNPDGHLAFAGNSNEIILSNLRALAAKARERIILRVPLVPGCTDSAENVEAIADLAKELELPKVELMPYHELGRDKYAGLGREYLLEYEAVDPVPDLDGALKIFGVRGIPCAIGGE